MNLFHLINSKQISIGDSVCVNAVLITSELSQRLFDLGIYKGAIIQYCGQAPFKGPFLFRIEMSLFALRENEIEVLEGSKLDSKLESKL